mmetsp:Transcript_26884/g.86357  ORF Transcript_26884/g.86357 Transcript_26884/m.86357 type:complete len:227 (+) Transcript_26884:1305-1985(+)
MPEHESAYRSFMLSLRPSDAAQFLKTRASAESFVSSSYVSSSPSSPPSPKASTTDATKHCCIRGRGFARSLGATAKTLGPAPAMAWSMTCLARASGPARQNVSGSPSPAWAAASGIWTVVGTMACCKGIASAELPCPSPPAGASPAAPAASCGTTAVVGRPLSSDTVGTLALLCANDGSFVRWVRPGPMPRGTAMPPAPPADVGSRSCAACEDSTGQLLGGATPAG